MSISIEALRRIVGDVSVSIRRRIEAAEALLTYECPSNVVEEAKAFLEEISSSTDDEIRVETRSKAAQVLLKAEARKVSAPSTSMAEGPSPSHLVARQRARNQLANELEARGLWPAPPGWDSHIMADDWPGLPPSSGEQVPDSKMAETVAATRQEHLKTLVVRKDSDNK